MKARVKKADKKAALFFMESEKADRVSALLEGLDIRVITPHRENCGGKIYSILSLSGFSAEDNIPAAEDFPSDELILFYDMENADVKKALDALRAEGISVRFKAVLTEYNARFTLPELMEHMFREEAALHGKK